jgi:dephospho-CoA kinase
LIVGLTGKACAGKSSLVPFFIDRAFSVVDADEIGHQALEANAAAVLSRFSTIDRRELGRMVFADPAALADLEAITQPWIARVIREQLASARGDSVLNAALLHKQDLYRLCDVIVWVDAPLWTRLLRARRRDGWSWLRLIRRVWAQRELRPQVFGTDVDIQRVDNGGPLLRALNALENRFGPVPK